MCATTEVERHAFVIQNSEPIKSDGNQLSDKKEEDTNPVTTSS